MKIESNHIYLGDCLKLMPYIEDASIDMILCDLPYGITQLKWDSEIPLNSLWKEYKRIIKTNGAIVLTAINPFAAKLIMSNETWFKYDVVWQKLCVSNPFLAKRQIMRQHELCLVFYNKQSVFNPIMEEYSEATKQRIKYSYKANAHSEHFFKKEVGKRGTKRYPKSVLKIKREVGLHPTQKPVALFEYLIKTYTNEGDIVLDNCVGSGTTAIAALNTNRRYIGMEKEKEYYDKAVYRINHRQTKIMSIATIQETKEKI